MNSFLRIQYLFYESLAFNNLSNCFIIDHQKLRLKKEMTEESIGLNSEGSETQKSPLADWISPVYNDNYPNYKPL